MPVQLTYAINTNPNPLTAGTADGSLTLVATNGTHNPVTVKGINIGIPVGADTDGAALTTVPKQIHPVPPPGWAMGDPNPSRGLYTFVFSPSNNRAIIQPGGSLVFTLTDIAVNGAAGTATVIVTEGSTGFPIIDMPVAKFPVDWGVVTFIAQPPNLTNGGAVTLNWDGPEEAVYTIQYEDDGQVINIPMAYAAPLSNDGTYPGPNDPALQISATTLFTLMVKAVIDGQSYQTEIQQTVTVYETPAITSFTGRITGIGANRQLTLAWETTNADTVVGSWTDSPLNVNDQTIPPITLPFAQTYSIIATASDGARTDPAYVNLSWKALSKITVGGSPIGVAITNDSKLAFVANRADGTVSVIDIHKMEVSRLITVGNFPVAIAITPDGNYAFVVNQDDGTVSVIDVSTLTVMETITMGGFPASIAITPDGKKAFVTNDNNPDGTVSVINVQTLTVTQTITVGGTPVGVAITPDNMYALITNQANKSLSVFDIQANKLLPDSISTGIAPSEIVITPDGNKAFVTNYIANTVSVIDLNNLTAMPQTIPTGNLPMGIASTVDGQHVFFANSGDSTMSIINVHNNTVGDTINVGNMPSAVAFTADGNYAFVTNFGDGTVSVLGLGLT